MGRSRASARQGGAGKTPTKADPEVRLFELLNRVWRSELKVKADYARLNAEIVAMAASLQLISTKTGSSNFASAWLLTTKGLTWLNERD